MRLTWLTVGALVLTACGGTNPPAPVTVIETATASPPTAASTTVSDGGSDLQDRVFFQDLQRTKEWDRYFSTQPRGALIHIGHTICQKFDGAGMTAVMQTLLDGGLTVEQAGYLGHASAMAYCPQHLFDSQ